MTSDDDDFEMEEVEVPKMSGSDVLVDRTPTNNTVTSSTNNATDDDDDEQWEEVDLPGQPTTSTQAPETGIQITITDKSAEKSKEKDNKTKTRRAGPSAEERTARLASHKIHAVALIANAKHRNKLLNDELLHARMLSLLPLHYQLAFSSLTPSNIPDPIERSRKFDKALKSLIDWWRITFQVDYSLKTLLTTPFADVQEDLNRKRYKGKGKERDKGETNTSNNYEVIRSEKSLQKRALQMKGSRDMSAQLFTALCRALNVPARLVTSVQAVPYRVQSQSVSKPVISIDDSSDDPDSALSKKEKFMTWQQRQKSGFKGDDEAFIRGEAVVANKAPPQIKLTSHYRKSNKKPTNNSSDFTTSSPPVFWTEVFSRPDCRWIVVDPIRNMIRTKARNMMDPQSLYKYNKMTYVVAFEEDGYGKDVTPRYAKQFATRTVKQRPPSKNFDWWDTVVRKIERPYRLARDDTEDAELHQAQFSEPMPQSMQGFKDHPVYVLERHLKREEVVNPPREIGRFKGEIVYPRANVQLLKTSENWLRQGRVVVEGAQPLKRVKQRAVTINKRRVQEAAALAGEEEIMQALYARNQTELYKAPPVVNGMVPKNKFGNVDLYVPSMLPEDAAHLPHKGIAKIAKKLGVDYGEAVTGFEFRQRRANPVISGIVVDASHKDAILDAYDEWQSQQAEKEHDKQLKEVYKQWQKVVQGLRIRERLKEYRGADQQPHERIDEVTEVNQLPGDGSHYQPGIYEQSLDAITKAKKALPYGRLNEAQDEISTADASTTNGGIVDANLEEVPIDDKDETKMDINVPAKIGQPVSLDVLIEQQEQAKQSNSSIHVANGEGYPTRHSKRARESSSDVVTTGNKRVTRSRISNNARDAARKENDEVVKSALGISDEIDDEYDEEEDEVVDVSSDE